MSSTPERIVELIGHLGTIEGLERVAAEVNRINTRLANPLSGLSRAELHEIAIGFDPLARAMFEMGRVVQTLIVSTTVRENEHAR